MYKYTHRYTFIYIYICYIALNNIENNFYTTVKEPSVGLYHIREHIRRAVPAFAYRKVYTIYNV